MIQNAENITVYCKNNNVYKEVPIGSSLIEIYAAVGSPLTYRPLCARVNNRIESLSFKCWQEKDIEFVDYTDRSGYRAYVRTLCFILTKAVYDIYPDKQFNLEHPVSKGYYCDFDDQTEITEETIQQIKQRMQEIIDADKPFIRKNVRTADAVCLFEKLKMNEKKLLLETTGMPYSEYYELDGYVDYYYGCLTPSAGYIQLFDIEKYNNGILLRVPQQTSPLELYPVVKQDKMFAAYKRHLTFQHTLGIEYVGDLNKAIQAGHTSEVIMVAEAMQEKRIASIAEKIAERYKEGVRVVMISGPSSSGKTTFCKRLQVQLMTNLIQPRGISLDDYYVNREDTPKDEDGKYDFESLYAIDLPYLKKDLQRLINGEEIESPTYNFQTGLREYRGNKLKLESNSILLMEGIHGLNPELTDTLPPESVYRVYVSALTTISLDDHNWIPTTDNRLIRRIVRDYQFRGYSAKQTISMWPSVRRGEDKWIFPYQENADEMFNSAMIYELAALRPIAEPILNEVRGYDKENAEAYRLLRFLRYFNYIHKDELSSTSLLREFMGGGKFKY